MAYYKLPLRKTQVPFNAKCWLDVNDPLIKKYPERLRNYGCERLVGGFAGLINDGNGRLLFHLKGLTFEEVPLGYLDWLSGQSWLYGAFRTRLTMYLTYGTKRELRPDGTVKVIYGPMEHE